MKKLLLPFLLILSISLFSQTYGPGKKGGGLYRTGADKLDKGWFFGIGGTYMLPYLKQSETIDFTDTLNQTFTQDYTAKPTGKFGLFLEIGKFKINGKRIFNYQDYGLSYKWFRGGENFAQTTTFNNLLYSQTETTGSYSDHALSLNFNIGHSYDASEKTFIVNGLGLNADYFIIKSRSGGGTILGQDQKFVSDFVGEIHYFFGVGFKTGKRLIIMPMIETPIFALYEFNHIKSTHDYFNTRSRPLIFKIRFMFLKKGSTSCPKVYNPMGIDPDNFQSE
ncbi:hypothetical protein FRY74_08125 [Vicingus serpentipes]|uniref:Outer membrane beta-barrel protein n=1 Tax=Vicingus serpentipes TaxID=1926625 RepID=A0A5C6RV21_9FLAO|nr:hypothetical protein [Vicingus serpentipes]TXB65380.1 hypothetical protein FRY74_08125 [Vicingus serpentipes]